MTRRFVFAVVIAVLGPTAAYGQKPVSMLPEMGKAEYFAILESAPFESISPVTGAPFYAEAVTEFTQVLGDGNRIERRYTSSIARDSRGRTRREEEIVLLPPLAPDDDATPRLVTIVDPEARVSYTLDQTNRTASRNPIAIAKLIELTKAAEAAVAKPVAPVAGRSATDRVVTESLGTRRVDGVTAEGVRTTSTIPAGSIGNLLPIEIVSERWFSPELQMPVLITRRDPRSGETVYRLTNIVRAEPTADLFLVPPDYDIREGSLKKWAWMQIEADKKKKAAARNK